MMTLIYILIVFFVCLIGYQLFLAFSGCKLIEGMDTVSTEGTPPVITDTTTTDATDSPSYQAYQGGSTADQALSLSKQNQYNIEYLNGEVKKIGGMSAEIDKMKLDIDTINDQMNELASSAGDLGTAISGDTTPDELGAITGTNTGETTDDQVSGVETSIDEEDGEDNEAQEVSNML